MKIASWNLNSIRARSERLLAWLERTGPDVVGLQELKGEESAFPHDEISSLGYHAVVHGQKTYNGVAILSRAEPVDAVKGWPDGGPAETEARLVAATVNDVRVVCAYVPNGGEVGSEKWEKKLAWLERLSEEMPRWIERWPRLVFVGDLNVAPEDRDVARPARWNDTVLCHEEVRARLRRITEGNLIDVVRLHHEGDGPYTWWDYRLLAFQKGNGLRIDHVFATTPEAERCTSADVDRDERKGTKPSDHAPVWARFES